MDQIIKNCAKFSEIFEIVPRKSAKMMEILKSGSMLGPDHLESVILKIIGKKIDNLFCHLQSIIPENNQFFAYYSGK